MKRYLNILLLLTLVLGLTITGCKKPDNPDNKKEEETKEEKILPYEFTNDQGESTVNIGQAKEYIIALRNYDNTFRSVPLSQSTIQLRINEFQSTFGTFIGGSTDQEQVDSAKRYLEKCMDVILQLSKDSNVEAASGKAGLYRVNSSGNDGNFYLDESGLIPQQLFQKSMIGALQASQILHLLPQALKASTEVMTGKVYTKAEHLWDIAYGTLGTIDMDINRKNPLFLANYIEKEAVGMEGFDKFEIEVNNAFVNGRKAIANKDLEAAKKQVVQIRKLLKKLLVKRTLFYFDEAQRDLDRNPQATPAYFKNMSEAVGFLLACAFVQDDKGNQLMNVPDALSIIRIIKKGEDGSLKNGVWNVNRMKGTDKGSIFWTKEKILDFFPNVN